MILGKFTLLLLSAVVSWQCQVFAQQAEVQVAVPQDTIITLQRFGDAFGNGTDYGLKVMADGTVVFQQVKDFKLTSPISSSISRDKMARLVTEFEKINYFSLKDRYVKAEDGCPAEWTDKGGAITSVTMNGKSKTIDHYHGCTEKMSKSVYPKELTELENIIDEIVGTNQWLK
jgi:Domain of unknown function (DUF6438)